jgi:hypothetical protein
MTSQLSITVPHGHTDEPVCPHCGEDLGDQLVSLYPESEPHECGGERQCPEYGGHLHVSVYRPPAVFCLTVPQSDDGVEWIPGARLRRKRAC